MAYEDEQTLPQIMEHARAGDWTDMATHRLRVLLRAARDVERGMAGLQSQCRDISRENASQLNAQLKMAKAFVDFGDSLGPLLQGKVNQLLAGLTNHTAKVITDIHEAHKKNLAEMEMVRKGMEAMRVDNLDARKGLELVQGELMMDQMKVAADRAANEADRKIINRRKSELERRVEVFSNLPLWQRIFPPKATERRAARDEG